MAAPAALQSVPQPGSGSPTGLRAWEHERFQRVTAELDLDQATVFALHCAGRSLIVELPLQRDDGSMTVLTGYRVQHSDALGPGKGGVDCDPRSLSRRELHEVTRLYTLAVLPVIGSDVDVPAPDIGTDEQTMAWMFHAAD
jgi:glutamate dehydrogenase (NAD(P)+)